MPLSKLVLERGGQGWGLRPKGEMKQAKYKAQFGNAV